jgi:hypothetical protein
METHMYSTERYTTANMQVYLLRCLAAMSPGFGINPERLCLGLGFEIADLSDPECRLSFRQASEMIRRTIELAPGRGIGLEIASNETIGSIGLVGYAMLTSPTFGDAVALGVDMQEYAGSMLQLDYTHDESRMSISATSRFHEPDIEMFLVEEAFGSFMKIGHALLGDHFRPSSVELSYDRPSYADQYERTFGCPVLFGRKDNVFSCDASWSSKRIATYDPLSHRQAVNLLELARTQDSDDSDLIESVERIVRRDLRQTPPLAAIADLAAKNGLLWGVVSVSVRRRTSAARVRAPAEFEAFNRGDCVRGGFQRLPQFPARFQALDRAHAPFSGVAPLCR